MPVYRVTAVSRVPELVLSGWAFVRSDRSEVHVAGYDEAGREGHVSPRIAAYDRALKAATATTGTKYLLVGLAGLRPDAQRALNWWLAGHNLVSWDDVTELVATYGLAAALMDCGRRCEP